MWADMMLEKQLRVLHLASDEMLMETLDSILKIRSFKAHFQNDTLPSRSDPLQQSHSSQ